MKSKLEALSIAAAVMRTVAKVDLTAHRTIDGMMRYNTFVFLSECSALPPRSEFFSAFGTSC